MVEQLGGECGPLQFLRELTQNGREALSRHGLEGDVVWDVYSYAHSGAAVRKLCIALRSRPSGT